MARNKRKTQQQQQQHETGIFRALFLSDQHASWKIELTCKKEQNFYFLYKRKKAKKKKSGAIFQRVWPKSIFKATSGSLGRHIIEACLQAITNLKGGNKSLSSQS